MSTNIDPTEHQSTPRARVAVLGGDGRPHAHVPTGCEVRYFAAAGDGGNGEARRLASALRAGTVDQVIILTRWNSHEVTRRIRRICKQQQIPVTVVR